MEHEHGNPVHVQTVLESDDLVDLKRLTNKQSSKEAVRVAVFDYLERNRETTTLNQFRDIKPAGKK